MPVALLMMSLVLPLNADDKEKPMAVREIDLKGLKLEPARGGFANPVEITTVEALAKSFPDKEVREKLEKQVDFGKQRLLYFAWAGSGQDKVSATTVEEDGKKVVAITFKQGLTKDLRRHFRLFAVDKDVPFKIAR